MLERMMEADELAAAVKRAEGAARRGSRRRSTADRQGAGRRVRRDAGRARTHRRASAPTLVGGARTRRCSASSRRSRRGATASPSPRRATASAPSATCGCGRRCSTPSSATSEIIQCDSCQRILYFVPAAGGRCRRRRRSRRRDATAPTAAPADASSPTSTAAPAAIPDRPDSASASNSPDGTLVEEFAESIGVATNNVAEYRGLLAALEWARAHATDTAARPIRLAAAGAADARQLQGEECRAAAAARAGAAAGARDRPRDASSTSAARSTRTPTGWPTPRWTARPGLMAPTSGRPRTVAPSSTAPMAGGAGRAAHASDRRRRAARAAIDDQRRRTIRHDSPCTVRRVNVDRRAHRRAPADRAGPPAVEQPVIGPHRRAKPALDLSPSANLSARKRVLDVLAHFVAHAPIDGPTAATRSPGALPNSRAIAVDRHRAARRRPGRASRRARPPPRRSAIAISSGTQSAV